MQEHFREYDDTLNKINETLARIRGYREALTLKGVTYTDMPKGSGGAVDISFYLCEIADLEQNLKELRERKNQLLYKHSQEIEGMQDVRYQAIIRMYYLDKMSFVEIADILNLSISHVRKLKKQAVKMFIESLRSE